MGSYSLSQLNAIHITPGNEDAGWQEVRAKCTGLSMWGARTLRDGLDGYVRTIIVEPRYMCKDYRNIYSRFYSKKFVERSSACCRLHFFSEENLPVGDALLNCEAHAKAYMGFSIIHPVLNNKSGKCLGRTVIDPFSCGRDKNNFYCLQAQYKVHLHGAEYAVAGYPYMCQDGEAMVCAHTVLWGVCRYLSQQYHEYGELYPYDLIELTGDALGRRVPYRRMSYSDYSTILNNFGCHPALCTPRTFPYDDWLDEKELALDVYSYLESGFPILMSFYKHVVAVIGHTCRSTLAFDDPDDNGFHDSYALLDQYVVVDDNFFPYQLLGDRSDNLDRNYGKQFEGRLATYPSKQDIYSAVIPLPEKAFLQPKDARHFGTSCLASSAIRPVVDQMLSDLGIDLSEPLITRLFLTSSNGFKKRKREFFQRSDDLLSQFPLRVDLPHFVWVMELSPLGLFNNHFVLGEVVMDATAGPREREPIYARVGNYVYFSGELKQHAEAAKSFRQYTHNLGER